jgi:hypothetical protein
MATNLRLRREVAEAVRAAAVQSGRSQQEIIREAIERYLAVTPASGQEGNLGVLIAGGIVRPPRTPYRRAERRLKLPTGLTSADIMNRDERL